MVWRPRQGPAYPFIRWKRWFRIIMPLCSPTVVYHAGQKMANLLGLVLSGIRQVFTWRIHAFRHYTTGSRDCTYVLVPSDSVFYQPVLCGCTRSTYSAYLPPSYPTRLCRYDVSNFPAKASCYIQPTLHTVPLRVCVTLSTLARFTCFHLHKVPRGPPPYALRAGSGQTHGRDVYGVIRCVELLVVFSVGTQPRRLQVMMCCSNPWACGRCYLFPSKVIPLRVG